jgi:type IV pilus assembly protein PilA
MNRKGFTLVELLAVIAILAILIIVVLPNIVSIFNQSKKEAFLIEVKSIFNSADVSYMKQSIEESNTIVFYRLEGDENIVPLSGRKQIYYYVKITRSGNIIEMLVWDGTNTLKKKDLNGIKISELNENDLINEFDSSNLNLEKIKLLFNES